MTTPNDRVELIKKLLAKAEGTSNEAERDAFNAKATQLMVQYGIEEAMIAAADAGDRLKTEKIVATECVVDVPKTYAHEFALMGIKIAKAMGGQGFFQKSHSGPTRAVLIGFESDVARYVMLFQSLTLQCTLALARHMKTVPSYWSGTDKYNARRSFIVGFANGVVDKLTAVKKDTVAHAAAGTDLVLVDRSARVKSWMDDEYRNLTTGRGRTYYQGGAAAGRAAGLRADIGGSKLGGNRRGIEG